MEIADKICCFNRKFAEDQGYAFRDNISWIEDLKNMNQDSMKFFDSVTGRQLFHAPVSRTLEEFIDESKKHGWPSFRDQEVNWD